MKRETSQNSTRKASITLVLDSDEAGQRATESSGRMLLDLFEYWGHPRYPVEPTSQAIARLQLEIDDLAQEIQGREALDISTDQTEYMRSLAWDYMVELMRTERETVYSRATSADELAAAIYAEEHPIEPQTGSIDFAKIKSDNQVEVFLGQYTDLRQRGLKWFGKCPLPEHDDDTPSFWVYPETQSWYCFGCHHGGDVIDFAKLKGIDLW